MDEDSSLRKYPLEALNNIQEPAPEEADEESFHKEAQDYDREAQKVELEHQREVIKSRKQDRRERKKYARHVFALVCVWLFAVLGLIFLQGVGGNVVFGWPPHIGPFSLSNSVLATLVGSTTASVVAIFAIVARYLFPRRDSN